MSDVHSPLLAARQGSQNLRLACNPVVAKGRDHAPLHQRLDPLVTPAGLQVGADGHHPQAGDGVYKHLKLPQGDIAVHGRHGPKVVNYGALPKKIRTI